MGSLADLTTRRALEAMLSLALLLGGAPSAANSVDRALDSFAAAWAETETYRCTITEHEVDGDRAQDRVYHMAFRKLHDTRLEIVEGDGKGGVLVWHGGPEARGHQGGLLRFLDLTVDIHDPRAVTIRGTTVAEANFGFLLQRFRSLDPRLLHVETRGSRTEIVVTPADPPADQGIRREVLVLGASGLPVEYRQLEGSQIVRDVSYSDVRVNVPIEESTFDL